VPTGGRPPPRQLAEPVDRLDVARHAGAAEVVVGPAAARSTGADSGEGLRHLVEGVVPRWASPAPAPAASRTSWVALEDGGGDRATRRADIERRLSGPWEAVDVAGDRGPSLALRWAPARRSGRGPPIGRRAWTAPVLYALPERLDPTDGLLPLPGGEAFRVARDVLGSAHRVAPRPRWRGPRNGRAGTPRGVLPVGRSTCLTRMRMSRRLLREAAEPGRWWAGVDQLVAGAARRRAPWP
jgi:hypothetical protein